MQVLHGGQDRGFKVALEVFLDEMRDDFSVGFCTELMAFRSQATLELQIIFDDPIVNDNDPSLTVTMRMRILFGRPAVRRPACVAQTVATTEGLLAQKQLQVAQLALRATHGNVAIAYDRYAR